MELGVKGRNFVLVGGTTGMGFGAAHQLAADGANVALLARDEQRAAESGTRHGEAGKEERTPTLRVPQLRRYRGVLKK